MTELHHPLDSSYGKLYKQRVKATFLDLYEQLVRHDENIAAYDLVTKSVPWFLRNDLDIVALRVHQERVTAHLRDPAVYAEYYGSNPHERPFEDQYGIEVKDIGGHFPRVNWLCDRILNREHHRVIDLACNDGAIDLYIQTKTGCKVGGVDLNPECVARARRRGISATVHDATQATQATSITGDAVVAMELIEHVPDPVELLRTMRDIAPWQYLSTPYGATDPARDDWHTDEYKGHVRAVLPDDVVMWAHAAGLDTHQVAVTNDGIIVAELSRV